MLKHDGKLLAIPKKRVDTHQNVDLVPIAEESNGGINASIVNPVAALIIQLTLIDYLSHKGII